MGDEKALVFVLLFGWGCLFNWITSEAIRHGYAEGFLWLLVAIGSGVTIAGVWYLFPDVGPWILVGFVCSGIPMCFGAIWRYVQARKKSQVDIRKET